MSLCRFIALCATGVTNGVMPVINRVMRASSERDDARERLERLFRHHHQAVSNYARRRVGTGLADDVVAETFLVAWRRLDDVPVDALPWLLGVARRTLSTQQRSAGRQTALAEKLAADIRAPIIDTSTSSELDIAVAEALVRLRPRDREAITLIAWDDLTPAQAAVVLGQTRAAFRVRLHRAKLRLRKEVARDPRAQIPIAFRPGLDEAECRGTQPL
jgi:RNA polymerase sigma-70 factor (ECF subfamily)